MDSYQTYVETAKEIRTKMKQILAIDISEFVKDPERFNEIRPLVRDIGASLSQELMETMRIPMKNYYIEELKKTNEAMKKNVEREAHLKQVLSSMNTANLVVPAYAANEIVKAANQILDATVDNDADAINVIKQMKPKYPIVKVKEYVTDNIKGLGFKCNEITGLPDELEPWYGHKIEHGKMLHKRIDLWLKKQKEKKVKKVKVAKTNDVKIESITIVDASSALLSL
jgi:hypothetical protein